MCNFIAIEVYLFAICGVFVFITKSYIPDDVSLCVK